jgi:hypothetical protein
VQIFFAAHGAFDKRDVNAFGKYFHIDERAINQIELRAQIHKALVHIEHGHVTPGATIQPNGSEFDFVHD